MIKATLFVLILVLLLLGSPPEVPEQTSDILERLRIQSSQQNTLGMQALEVQRCISEGFSKKKEKKKKARWVHMRAFDHVTKLGSFCLGGK